MAVIKHKHFAFRIYDRLSFLGNPVDLLITRNDRPVILSTFCNPVHIQHVFSPTLIPVQLDRHSDSLQQLWYQFAVGAIEEERG